MSGFVLGEVARYLKVPVTYFYEGYDYNTFTSQLTYKDNEPEIHVNNQHRNEKHYPNPNSYGEITDHLNLQVVAAQKSNLYYGTDLLSDATRIVLMDMANLDGSDNMRLVARYSGGVQTGVGADIVRQS